MDFHRGLGWVSPWGKDHGGGTLLHSCWKQESAPARNSWRIPFSLPGSESRSGLLSYFLLTLGLTGPSLSELNSPSKTPAWFLLTSVNPKRGHLADRLTSWHCNNNACAAVIKMGTPNALGFCAEHCAKYFAYAFLPSSPSMYHYVSHFAGEEIVQSSHNLILNHYNHPPTHPKDLSCPFIIN